MVARTGNLGRSVVNRTRSRSKSKYALACFVSAAIGLSPSYGAYAQSLPTGGQVTAGQATISAPSGNQLLIQQSSPRAIINWQGFSIGEGNSVSFNNGSGATLNRVVSSNPSSIYGNLNATGSVYLINPNGVVIGPTGRIETGGSFIASTLDVLDSQFIAGGALTFSGSSDAEIINLGQISSLGGDVSLIALKVTNEGTIDAPNGTAGLIAGREILMRDAAVADGKFFVKLGSSTSTVTNKGTIRAAEAELRANGGNVYALAGNTGGAIQATGTATRGGRVFLTSPGGQVISSGRVTARKQRTGGLKSDGGSVFINADYAGLSGKIDAKGIAGGEVAIDVASLIFGGSINATGSAEKGGTVDISVGEEAAFVASGLVDVSGTSGGKINFQAGLNSMTSATFLAKGTSGTGGQIDFTAGGIQLLSPTFDASGATGGGTIRIGGEFQGGKKLLIDEIENARKLAVTDGTVVRADTTGTDGDGGTIVLWSDERSAVFGQLSAKPGRVTGTGGLIEVSSAGELLYRATVDTGPAGRTGTLLLDPKNIVVDNISVEQSFFVLSDGYQVRSEDVLSLDSGDFFGFSVAVSDGLLAVGAYLDDTGNTNRGAAYLFSFDAGTAYQNLTLAIKLAHGTPLAGATPSLSITNFDTHFGSSVALTDGLLAVGAQRDDTGGTNRGAAYLFSFDAGTAYQNLTSQPSLRMAVRSPAQLRTLAL